MEMELASSISVILRNHGALPCIQWSDWYFGAMLAVSRRFIEPESTEPTEWSWPQNWMVSQLLLSTHNWIYFSMHMENVLMSWIWMDETSEYSWPCENASIAFNWLILFRYSSSDGIWFRRTSVRWYHWQRCKAIAIGWTRRVASNALR